MKLNIEPEPVIFIQVAFGIRPATGCARKACQRSGGLWQAIAEDESNKALEQLAAKVFHNLDKEIKRLMLRMTNLDPAKRALVAHIIMDPY